MVRLAEWFNEAKEDMQHPHWDVLAPAIKKSALMSMKHVTGLHHTQRLDIAQDIQEEFVRKRKRLHFENDFQFHGYIRKAAIVHAIRKVRKEKKQVTLGTELAKTMLDHEPDLAIGTVNRHTLARAISELPIHHKTMFFLRFLAQKGKPVPIKQIAQYLGVSESTVKTRLSTAKNWLRKKLAGE
jgi:RNA polymerase sigma factor (sigma-70 family)